MDAESVFVSGKDQIIDDAAAALRSPGTHYATDEQATRSRLTTLFDVVVTAIRDRRLGPVATYARDLAQQRYSAGYGIGEVQTALNALEEAAWRYVAAHCEGDDLIQAVGLLGTVLGEAKDELAREYVSLASHSRVPSLDLSALFEGAAPGITPQQDEPA